MSEIEVAPYAPLLVYKKSYTPDFVKRKLKEHKLIGLRIFAILEEDRMPNLDFLSDFTFLKVLHIDSAGEQDFSFLHHLTELEDLSIQARGRSEIRLTELSRLQRLSIRWRPIVGLDKLKKLISLSISEFKVKDLSVLSSLDNLKELAINTGSIQTLNGIQSLRNLESLVLGYCRSLISVSAVNGLLELKRWEIDSCPKIEDYELLTALPQLKELELIDCQKVPSIQFIDNFPRLSKLSLLGNTVVVDGNLIPAKRIKEVLHAHRKHYNVTIENKAYDKLIRKNISKIRRYFFGK